MQHRPASPAVARFLARTAAAFSPPPVRPAAPVTRADREHAAERSMGRMLLAMAALLLLAWALAGAERRAAGSSAPVPLTVGR